MPRLICFATKKASKPMSLRLYSLLTIAFCTGAVVMSFEILGSRVLAPTLGSSVFVWGALIGVVMTGLAIGYFGGGFLSDLCSSFRVLALLLFLPGLLLLFFPFYGYALLEVLSFFDLGPRLGPFVACLALFLLPTVFLGAVSPYSVRLLVHDLARLGRSVGLLYGFSTAGSIAGTLGTAFFLILWIGTRASFFLLGSLTLALSFLAFFQYLIGARETASSSYPSL